MIGLTGGVTLFYELGPRQPICDTSGRWRRDERGRTALEAFGALPLLEMYERLERGTEAWRAKSERVRASTIARDPQREPRRWMDAFAELARFVETFGPLGFDWGRTLSVRNAVAERAQAELDELRLERTLVAMGQPSEEARLGARRGAARRAGRRWQVTFLGPGFEIPEVREVRTDPSRTWEERVRLGDDALPRDFLGPGTAGSLWHHQDDLNRIIELIRVLTSERPDPHRIRAAVGRLPGFGRYDVDEPAARDPIGLYWRDATRVALAADRGWWAPMKEHPRSVDWNVAGRLALATFLSEQLSWTAIGVGLDERRVIHGRWMTTSLMDVIYLQLLEHIEERMDFGIGLCALCGGPILNSRREGPTRNAAHRGCSTVLRKRRQRARARAS